MLKININKTICYSLMVLVGLLLYLRDAMEIPINKMLFVVLLIPALLFLKEKYAIILWFFLMPLYVGLPGNFLTIAMFGRILLKYIRRGWKIRHKPAFFLTLLIAIQIFIQNYWYGYTTIYHMICILELFLVYFIFCENLHEGFSDMCIAYSSGVAMVGLVMLMSTLRYKTFADLLSVASRLGDVDKTVMSVQIDPNYYGLFAIIVISINWLMINKKLYTRIQRIFGSVLSVVCLCVALIGLSRAFILCLAIWLILVVVTEDRLTTKVKIILIALVSCIGIIMMFPDVIDALRVRFLGKDMVTGNGRTDKLVFYYAEWVGSIFSLVFGIGLFNCSAHCMQAQYLYGLGMYGAVLMLLLGIYYTKVSCHQVKKVKLVTVIPIIVTQVAAFTVPIAQSLTYMLPIVMSVLILREVNYK